MNYRRLLVITALVVLLGLFLKESLRSYHLEQRLELFITKWKFTTEELNLAYSMLTFDEKNKVQIKFEANEEFLRTVFDKLD